MNREEFQDRKLENFLHSAVLLAAMVGLLLILGYQVFGGPGVTVAFALAGVALALAPRLHPSWIMRLHRARPLGAYEAPGLTRLAQELARRADLPSVPQLFYIPSAVPNAFAVGSVEQSAIGISDGLIRRLGHREMAGVLAHEVSHVKNHDLRIMGLAQAMSNLTRTLSLAGQVILVLSLPLALFGQLYLPWFTIALLIVAPTVSALLQLALSRTREFEADLGAAQLTGDPLALASALAKLEAPAGGWLWRLLTPYRRQEASPLLRSHPATEERVHRLKSLAMPAEPSRVPVHTRRAPIHSRPQRRLVPRRYAHAAPARSTQHRPFGRLPSRRPPGMIVWV